jgi:hypothetical protein
MALRELRRAIRLARSVDEKILYERSLRAAELLKTETP